MKLHRVTNETIVVCIFLLFPTNAFDDDYYEYEDPPITTCENNDAYVSLESCMRECMHVHQSGPEPEPKPYGEDKMRFIVIKLASHEFQLDATGYPLTNLPLSISRDSFVVNRVQDSAIVCYPLEPDFIACKKWHLEKNEFELHNNSRYLLSKPHNTLHPLGKFYLEVFSDGMSEAAVCIPSSALEKKKSPIESMFLAAYAISALSLILTFVLSIIIAELNIRNNYILLCHLVVLTFAYVLLFLRNVITGSTQSGCLIMALLQQFTLLASFFWINVQAIDLFIRFIHLRGNCDMRTSSRRFILYCTYAWGCPSLICMITLGMEKSDARSFHPNFRFHCWFDKSDKLTSFVYFYGPIAIILLANVVLFILTVSKLYKLGKAVNNVNKKMHSQLLQLYLKLVIVMGLCWIMELISWAIEGDKEDWYFTDLINALQGLFIFLIYVCKPSYIRRILYQNSFFPNRPKCWPWKRDARCKPDQEDDSKNRHGTLSTTTSLTGHELVQINTSFDGLAHEKNTHDQRTRARARARAESGQKLRDEKLEEVEMTLKTGNEEGNDAPSTVDEGM
uniref:G-protein coupled receptors family 2 profile 2 domain-containing protein n=1 Tax=Strigamia maritima TaxID=126957 RepID=T1JCW3_STRMM